MIETDSDAAREILGRIETASGDWTAYGGDGRLTTDAVDAVRQEAAGTGFRSRFVDCPHGDDYGWGPLAQTGTEAVAVFLAQHVGAVEAA